MQRIFYPPNAVVALLRVRDLISPELHHPQLHKQNSPWTKIILDYIGRSSDEKKGSRKNIQIQKMHLSFRLQFESREALLYARFFRTRISNIIYLYCDGFCFETLRLITFYTPTIQTKKTIKHEPVRVKLSKVNASHLHVIGSDSFVLKKRPTKKEKYPRNNLFRKARNMKKAFGHFRQKERNIKRENLVAETGGIFGYDDTIDFDSDQDRHFESDDHHDESDGDPFYDPWDDYW